jgi:membrane-bound ClpP family serine protease
MADGKTSTTRSLMGPAMLITIGVLFLIGELHPGYGFGRTWPVILLVIGAIKLAEAVSPGESRKPQ